MRPAPRPVVLFFAFANDRVERARYLRNLPEEQRRVRAAMGGAVQARLCEVVERANATIDEVLGVFQDPAYRDRVAVFHFGGHAGSGALLLESPEGAATAAHAAGLARFLGEQRGLELVFLNGCSSKDHAQGLVDAGVPMVIVTSQSIADEVATELSARFYAALGSGTSIRTAFAEASGAVQTRYGARVRRDLQADPGMAGLADESWPWDLYVAPGAEESPERWSLPQVAGDPLFGLPPLPALDFPPSPFRHLAPFTREEAAVFFGRGREIRELFDALTLPDGAPIVLLFGAAGVGKSSLLAAGLQPRLEASHDVLYLRRDRTLGLSGTLARGLASGTDRATAEATIEAAWRRREARIGRPLVVILDQAEEAWTHPLPGSTEAEMLAAALRPLFAARDRRPFGRLLVSFRKEWLAEVLRLLDAEKLPVHRVELSHLGLQGIIEATAGLPSSARLRRHYGLEVEPDLPGLLAADLLADPAATIAPALQILLTKMWARAIQASPAAPCFTVALYQYMKRRGILLDDFVEEQLRGLAGWRPDLVRSGLVLDLLAFHTTSLGSAETREAAEVANRYGGRREVGDLIEQCQDRYLLTVAAPDQEGELATLAESRGQSPEKADRRTTRLAHDTLAPLVRRRFETSDLPGQRALRILEQRAREWDGGRAGPPLDAFDLAQVAAGQRGMRVRTADEERMVAASRKQADQRRLRRRGLQLAAAVGVAMLFGAMVVAWWQRNRAVVSDERSRDRADAALGANLVVDHPTEAALVLLEVRQADSTPTTDNSLYGTLGATLEFQNLIGHKADVVAASFSPDGTRVVTASWDHSARIWNSVTGQMIATLTGHTNDVWAASFSPDGSRVVTASDDHTARIWNAATGHTIATLTGHTDIVRVASFSPDGTRVVTASKDDTARIWNVATGHTLATLNGHTDWVKAASFSPDGTRVVTGSWDNTARIWNAATGQTIATLTGHTKDIWAVSFSPDGTRVVTASDDHTARIWNAATGQPITTLTGHTGYVRAASFSPDGTRVVTASNDHTARIWNAGTGQPIATLTGHTNVVETASFSPDGTRVVTASWDNTAWIWDVATGQPITTFTKHTDTIWAASFSPDGTLVVTAGDRTARIWSSASGQAIATFTGHTEEVDYASFSLNGARIMTRSRDRTARIWNAATGKTVATFGGETRPVNVASFSPDGTRAVTASGPMARISDAATGRTIATLTGDTERVEDASFSSDSTRVVTVAGDTARIWNAATGQPIASLIGHTGLVAVASFSPDGTRVVTASSDKTARVWNTATGQQIAILTGHTNRVWAASFSPDGTHVLTASPDKTARIWNAATGQHIATLTGNTDGTDVVTGSTAKTVRIWNGANGQQIATLTDGTDVVTGTPAKIVRIRNANGRQTAFFREPEDEIRAAFSPDGNQVLTRFGSTARIWNAATGQPIATLTGHTDRVDEASFSPDGTRLVTASWDHTARIWNVATGQTIATLIGHTGMVIGASFSHDGAHVVTASFDKTARVWNATTGQPIATLAGDTDVIWMASFSSDGTRVLTASGDHSVRIWPTGGEYLQSRIRARTALCLVADFRQVNLGEHPSEAGIHEKACKACVPQFFARLQGVPSGDWQTYLAAWRVYRGCLDTVR